ncbi:MAG: flagellar biosynthesis protein FliR [Aliidongia sp.]|jgi:flagellar biosynthetic protein FliR|nr:flagellar biosynthesis protein FliR [Aliidongia sp.]
MHSYTLEQLLPANVFALLLVVTRIAGALSFLPGFGDAYVSVRVRVVLAVTITLVVTPLLADHLPAEPGDFAVLSALIATEAFIGSFIGLIARVLLGSLETAGAIIATQSSLASAITFDPGSQRNETLPASLMGALALVLIFALNLHHMLLAGLVDSYQAFPAGEVPPLDDMSRAMVRLVAQGFVIALEIAAPYIILGTLFYLALGLVGRIMPQLQIFYLGLPLQILGGLTMLMVTIGAAVMWFLGTFADVMRNFTTLQ